MKIAIFYNVSPGGAKRVIFEQSKYLFKKKHDIDVYIYENTDDSYMPVGKYSEHIYKIKNYIPAANKGFKRILYDYSVLVRLNHISKILAKIIDSGGYDVILVHPDNYTQAPYILRYMKTPSIYFCEELLRNTYEEKLNVDKSLPAHKYLYEKLIRNIRKQVDKKNTQYANIIMTASVYIKNKVKVAYRKDAVVNKLGVDTEIFKNKKDKKNYLLFIGQKEEITGYYFAKKIIETLDKDLNLTLKVIDGKSDKLKSSDREMSDLYSKAFLTLCVSYEEPFGLTSIESMACGTPVLAVNEGGYKESVIDGDTGYLLKREPKLFADKISSLYKNQELYKKLSESGSRYVKDNWTWEKHGERLVNAMENIINDNKTI